MGVLKLKVLAAPSTLKLGAVQHLYLFCRLQVFLVSIFVQYVFPENSGRDGSEKGMQHIASRLAAKSQ